MTLVPQPTCRPLKLLPTLLPTPTLTKPFRRPLSTSPKSAAHFGGNVSRSSNPSSGQSGGFYSSSPKLQTTLLPCGARVVSFDRKGPLTSLGVFFGLGWQHERKGEAGSTATLERIFQRSLDDWAHRERLSLQLGPDNSRFLASFLRERFFADFAPELLGRLASFFAPVPNDEVEEWRRITESTFVESDPLTLFQELLPFAALRGQSHGHSLHFHQAINKPGSAQPENFPIFNPTPEAAYMSAFVKRCLGDRQSLVFVASDCDHEEVVEFANAFVSCLDEVAPLSGKRRSIEEQTNAGSILKPGLGSFVSPQVKPATTQLALLLDTTHLDGGFRSETFGDKTIGPLALQTLLGGGDTFSTGGPGKGMFSRLHLNVLPMWGVETCVASALRTRSGSALAVIADIGHTHVEECEERIQEELNRTTKITTAELKMIKNQLSFSLWSQLERPEGVIEDIGTQLVNHSHWLSPALSPDGFQRAIDSLSKDSIKRFANSVLQAPRSLVMMGPSEVLGRVQNCIAFKSPAAK